MKTNESKMAFIGFHLFFRIGTFQWVTSEKNKKFRRLPHSRPRLWANRAKPPFRLHVSRPARQPKARSSDEEKHDTNSDFVKTLWSHLDSAASLLAR
jgi:hypothetical protein